MAEINGFIKIHRKMLNWGWYDEPATKAVFLHLLLTANFKETEYRGQKVGIGQTVIGRKKLADILGLSERQVRTALKHLEESGEIRIEVTNRFSVVTVENWAKYQLQCDEATNKRPTNDQQMTNKRPTDDQQTTTLEEVKNIRNKEYKNNIYTSPSKGDEVKKSHINYQEIVDLYNDTCHSLPKAKALSDNRKRAIKKIIDKYGREKLEEVFVLTERSDFLKGKTGSWRGATFDWIVKEQNFVKILEGNYESRGGARKGNYDDVLEMLGGK